MKHKEEKRTHKDKRSKSKLWDNFKGPTMQLIRVLEEESRIETEKIFQEIMTRNFQNLMNSINPRSLRNPQQETQKTHPSISQLNCSKSIIEILKSAKKDALCRKKNKNDIRFLIGDNKSEKIAQQYL